MHPPIDHSPHPQNQFQLSYTDCTLDSTDEKGNNERDHPVTDMKELEKNE